MKILATSSLTPGTTPEKLYPLMKEEAAKAWELYAEGTFREMYFRQDGLGVVLMLECGDMEKAKAILDTLPMVKAGLTQFEVIPLVYPAFIEGLWK